MTERSFVARVAPVAAELRETRSQIADVARTAPAEAWSKASPSEGWTCKDLLAHLATGDWVFQGVLGLVTEGEGRLMSGIEEINEGNAERIAARREASPAELAAEVEAMGERTQELLSKLADGHESLKGENAPMSLGEYLRGFPGHDRAHLDQLRRALEG